MDQQRIKDDQIRDNDQRIVDLTDKLTEIKLLTEANPVEQPQLITVPNSEPEPEAEPEQPKKKRWWQF